MSLILKVGRYYVNGRGDFFGPMVMAAANLWLDQYDTAYTTDGKVQNHVKGSMANLVEEVTAGYICIKHNSLSERVAEIENAVSGERVREALEMGLDKFMTHASDCKRYLHPNSHECSCGFDEWYKNALLLAAQPEGK